MGGPRRAWPRLRAAALLLRRLRERVPAPRHRPHPGDVGCARRASPDKCGGAGRRRASVLSAKASGCLVASGSAPEPAPVPACAMADEGKSYNEHDDRVSFPQRRKKGRGPFRWKCGEGNRRSGRGGSGIRSSRFEEDDGDVAMNDPQDGPRVRYNPYTNRPNRRRDTWHDRDRIHVTVRRDRAPQERGGAGTSQDGTTKNWFKITIPYGKKYDKMWLLSMIQSKCSVPFNPIEFHYENTRAQFFVEDATTASALKAVNYKIQDRENRRISIIINSSAPPYIVQNELKPEQVEQLKLIMSKRYDGSQQALDLKGLRSDPDLVAQNIDVVLNRRGCMAAALRIIEENIPELLSLNLSNNRLYKLDDMSSIVQKAPNLKILNLSGNELKSEWELDKIKGLKLEELWLDRNPMCDTFLDQSTYIRSVVASVSPPGDIHPLGG